MVDFNTRIFSEDDGKIIGAEITVYSDSGNKLGSISVADAETLEQMQEQLAVIDETYFTEERLATILSNINESQEINATKLAGFLSSDFAKTSQLSNYAPLSHNHSVSQISDLYEYSMHAPKYNVNSGDTATVVVRVTKNDQPVVGVTVPVLLNNMVWMSGVTGSNGNFALSYTTTTWGIINFSAGKKNIQVNVTGWKQVQTFMNGGVEALTDGQNLCMKFHREGNVNYDSHKLYLIGTLNSDYRPSGWVEVIANDYDSQNTYIRIESDGKVYAKNLSCTSTSGSCSLYTQFVVPLASPLY